jgi:hypothetical protein
MARRAVPTSLSERKNNNIVVIREPFVVQNYGFFYLSLLGNRRHTYLLQDFVIWELRVLVLL